MWVSALQERYAKKRGVSDENAGTKRTIFLSTEKKKKAIGDRGEVMRIHRLDHHAPLPPSPLPVLSHHHTHATRSTGIGARSRAHGATAYALLSWERNTAVVGRFSSPTTTPNHGIIFFPCLHPRASSPAARYTYAWPKMKTSDQQRRCIQPPLRYRMLSGVLEPDLEP